MPIAYTGAFTVVSGGFVYPESSVLSNPITESKVVTSDNAGKQLIEVMELMGIN